MPKPRTFSSDYYVCPDRQLKAAAETKPLHGRDHRYRKPLEAIEDHHIPIKRRAQMPGRHVGPIHNVATETKVRPFRAEKNCAAFAAFDRVNYIGELLGHRVVDPVLWWIVKRNHGNRSLEFQRYVGHGCFPSGREVQAEPVQCGGAGKIEAGQIGVEVSAGDEDKLLGLERLFIRREGEVGKRDRVVRSNHH